MFPEDKAILGRLADARGMTHKAFLGRVLRWFDSLTETEQAIVLDQVSRGDQGAVAALVLSRVPPADIQDVARRLTLLHAALEAAQPKKPAPASKDARRHA